jgi:uncharacterized LabA/DUF88 family protein
LGGVIFLEQQSVREPSLKRAIAFFDGQNLFHSARAAFGYSWPNYDPAALAHEVCRRQGWQLEQVRFYTGIPTAERNPRWSQFWQVKLARLHRLRVHTFSRPLRYQGEIGREKGIDVRIALDIVTLAFEGRFDVAVLFSQDNDLSEVAEDLRQIARREQRWLKIASAFPISASSRNRRGIDRTDWIPIERAFYDECLDPSDYTSVWNPATEALRP